MPSFWNSDVYQLSGLPLPEGFEDGVKMKCSNAVCEYQEQLIHLECFHALEDNLIKIMSNIGRELLLFFSFFVLFELLLSEYGF